MGHFPVRCIWNLSGNIMLAAVRFSISGDMLSGPEDLLVSREARIDSSVHSSELGISPEEGCA